tara:strand:+ start:4722 stop:5231 length:510 start_codon:yes stop_codon:yes gene_type:complete
VSTNKKTAFMLVGNYGVGKSTLIKEPVLDRQTILLKTHENIWVLGKTIIGADSLSSMKKEDVINELVKHTDKNIIITGNYYSQQTDVIKLSEGFNVVIIYLKTSFAENVKRIAMRGKTINVSTYNSKLKLHYNMMVKTKHLAKIHVIDNDRAFTEVKQDITKILQDEQN